MDCERAANKYKQVEFMQDFVGEDFDAVISGVAAFGFWAETVAHKCEGMVPGHDLMEFDDFLFIESEYALVGQRTGLRFAMGDKIKVRVAATNLEKRQIDFAVMELPASKPGKPARKTQATAGRKVPAARTAQKTTTKKATDKTATKNTAAPKSAAAPKKTNQKPKK